MPKGPVHNSDKRLKNLRPWKPGQSGNSKGRPRKDVCLTSLLQKEIKQTNPQDKKQRTWAELLVLATIKLAIRGNQAALKEIWLRIDGKPKDAVATDENRVQIILKGVRRIPGSNARVKTTGTENDEVY